MDCIGNNRSERINAFEEEMNVKTSIQSIWGGDVVCSAPPAPFNKVNGVQLFMKITRSAVLVLIFLASFVVAGCSSIQSAYTSTVDTVSGWMKSDDKKSEDKK